MDLNQYERAIEENYGDIYRYCCRMLRDYHAAQDISQDVFVKYYKAIGKKVSSEKAYLYRSAYHLCIDFIRRKHRIGFTEIDEKHPSDNGEPERTVLESCYSPEIEYCLSRLTYLQRSILIWRSVDGMDYREIAELLGKREAAVRKQYQRAKDEIEKLLKLNGGIDCENRIISGVSKSIGG